MTFFFDQAGASAFSVLTGIESTTGVIGAIVLPKIVLSEVETSNSTVAVDLAIPAGAVVTRAVVRVRAEAPGQTPIGGIATVRAAAGDPGFASSQLVVDFGTLRTVSSVQVPDSTGVSSVMPWVGTTFDGGRFFEGGQSWVDFTELQTERLLVSLTSALSPDTLAAQGHVTTTTPPADLELHVASARVWFRAGPAPPGFTQDVDVTAAVQAAVDAGGTADTGGNLHVPLVLSARVPGSIGVELPEQPRFLRTLTVDFPGSTTAARFAEEGQADVELPLPAGSDSWTVQRVIATVAAEDPGPVRIVPPVGPAASEAAEILLDADRRLTALVPPSARRRMDQVSGVRIRLTPETGGIEVGGALLSGDETAPGDPLPDVVFTPLDVPAAMVPTWVTLALPRPVPVAVDKAVWVSLSVARGRAVLELAAAEGMPTDDQATIRRIAPNGIAHPPSTAVLAREDGAAAVAVRTDVLSLRVVGEPRAATPIDVVDVDLAGGGTVRDPSPPGVVTLSLDPPGPRDPLQLRLTATAATTVTVGPVVVAYTEETDL